MPHYKDDRTLKSKQNTTTERNPFPSEGSAKGPTGKVVEILVMAFGIVAEFSGVLRLVIVTYAATRLQNPTRQKSNLIRGSKQLLSA